MFTESPIMQWKCNGKSCDPLSPFYGIETGALNRAVKRNAERFPEDFMFQITGEEAKLLRCQTGISKPV